MHRSMFELDAPRFEHGLHLAEAARKRLKAELRRRCPPRLSALAALCELAWLAAAWLPIAVGLLFFDRCLLLRMRGGIHSFPMSRRPCSTCRVTP